MNAGKIFLPQPCHENWDAMNPETGGRHCQSCQKVVMDFTQNTVEEIQAEIQSHAPGEICGRMKAEHVEKPIEAEIYFKFPVQRLRKFVLALITVFGMQWFGFSIAEAQNGIPNKENPEFVVTQTRPDSIIEIGGIVTDSLDPKPLEGVTVMVTQNGTPIAGSITNREGKFRMRLSASKLNGQPYDIRIAWWGHNRTFKNVASDVREMVVLLNSDYIINTIVISSSSDRRWEVQGKFFQGIPMDIQRFRGYAIHDDKGNRYYHELNDFIQMRSSEVHMQNGW